MILALRPVRLEPLLDGLDKTYRLHKWLGITGLVVRRHPLAVGAGHQVGGGLGLAGQAGARAEPRSTDPVEIFFSAQRGLAEIGRRMGLLRGRGADRDRARQALSVPAFLQDPPPAGASLSGAGVPLGAC